MSLDARFMPSRKEVIRRLHFPKISALTKVRSVVKCRGKEVLEVIVMGKRRAGVKRLGYEGHSVCDDAMPDRTCRGFLETVSVVSRANVWCTISQESLYRHIWADKSEVETCIFICANAEKNAMSAGLRRRGDA